MSTLGQDAPATGVVNVKNFTHPMGLKYLTCGLICIILYYIFI